jgi:hypothetical protein
MRGCSTETNITITRDDSSCAYSVAASETTLAGEKFARPGTVIDASHDRTLHMFHRARHILKKRNPFISRPDVFRHQVHVGCHANTVSEAETGLDPPSASDCLDPKSISRMSPAARAIGFCFVGSNRI